MIERGGRVEKMNPPKLRLKAKKNIKVRIKARIIRLKFRASLARVSPLKQTPEFLRDIAAVGFEKLHDLSLILDGIADDISLPTHSKVI
jgi:hypothetical protein